MRFVDLLSEYHIMPQFPPNVVRQAGSIPVEVTDADLKDRVDLEDLLTITIDGDDAKDFDDAVSLEILENGNFCLGVHIADVTHYVSENSPIDRAAFSRGTSVYLIDTVIPMLPFELSNELCSLKPNQTRLTVSVFMEIDSKGIVKDYKICKSFIKSHQRMTYAKVTKILENDRGLCEKYSHLVPMLKNMKCLADILNKKRVKNGSIEFVTHESKITLDKNGVPTDVCRYPITISNNIIEEFMLMANVTVAKHLSKNDLPCVYRVHESPDFDRVERLAKVLPELGVEFRFKPDMRPRDFQNILESVSSLDTCSVVNYLVLRSMSRARYSENNLGHFGLAFGDYCHFTSPIRRYPDLVVHRILKESLEGEVKTNRLEYFKALTVSASVTASVTESNAAEAELKWKDIKKAEYMTKHIGEKYIATITHVTASGFFAELENTVEGFVPARTIEDDLYMMTDNGLALEGTRSKGRFTIGDKVEVKVVAADIEDAKIDFEVVGSRQLKPLRRKQNKNRSDKKVLSKEEKRVLRKFKAEQREEKQQKRNDRSKADAERYIFENAITYELFQLLDSKYKFKKAEKGFVGVTLRDLASVISAPVYRANLFDIDEVAFENAIVSASMNVRNTFGIICDSFGIEEDEVLVQFAVKYVCKALRHFDDCMQLENINFTKRENEYDSIMNKLKLRRKEER
ncbi:MAG: ribonuclease R [Clostridia bacterium]|nr:ribonuclease R [Clostridia bacterium]